MRNRNMSNSTAAWMMPAMGVRPPLLMFVMVRAMAPVAGIPPNSGEARLAIPCAISSVFESWWSPVTPSATAADSSDSMAPSMAMVRAGDTNPLMVSHVISGTCAPGSWLLMEKRSPMVSTLSTPANCLSNSTATVITTMAMSEPGIFLLKRGVTTMMITLTMPTAADRQSIVVICWK